MRVDLFYLRELAGTRQALADRLFEEQQVIFVALCVFPQRKGDFEISDGILGLPSRAKVRRGTRRQRRLEIVGNSARRFGRELIDCRTLPLNGDAIQLVGARLICTEGREDINELTDFRNVIRESVRNRDPTNRSPGKSKRQNAK